MNATKRAAGAWSSKVLRYAAFSTTPSGGNPAGVVLDAEHLTDTQMQDIAAYVGYSETAFLTTPITDDEPITIRYFAPEGEVAFCGHATIATTVALGDTAGKGTYLLHTNVGTITVRAASDAAGSTGTFLSAPIDRFPLPEEHLAALLKTLRWTRDDLHPDYTPAIGFGGNKHPVLIIKDTPTLSALDYDFPALQRLCRENNWITVQLAVPVTPALWRSRNPFPWGGVVEDPATGAAAAALVGYLAPSRNITPGKPLTIHQGHDMVQPSTITVTVHEGRARITGHATLISAEGRSSAVI